MGGRPEPTAAGHAMSVCPRPRHVQDRRAGLVGLPVCGGGDPRALIFTSGRQHALRTRNVDSVTLHRGRVTARRPAIVTALATLGFFIVPIVVFGVCVRAGVRVQLGRPR
jgi:hypothetical protein